MSKVFNDRDDHHFKDTLRSLSTRKEKWDYIWEYYHWWFLGALLVILIIVSFCLSLYKESAPVYLSGAYLDITMVDAVEDFQPGFLKDDFLHGYLGLPENDRTKMETFLHLPLPLTPDDFTQANGDSSHVRDVGQTISFMDAHMATHDIDYIVFSGNLLKLIELRYDCLYDLREIMSAEELERYSDQLIYNESGIPVAIDISYSQLIRRMGLVGNPPICLGWCVYTENPERFQPFFQYIEVPEHNP